MSVHTASEKTWLINAVIFDGKDVIQESNILVVDSKIEKVTSGDVPDEEIADTKVIDCEGRMVTPGFIDIHIHAIANISLHDIQTMPSHIRALHTSKALESTLQRGFTTVRDAGGIDGTWSRAVDTGLVSGPRIFASGKIISQTGGHGDMFPVDDGCKCHRLLREMKDVVFVADGPDAVLKASRENLKSGCTQIKICTSGGVASPHDHLSSVQYLPEEVSVVTRATTNWGTYVMSHSYADDAILMAVNNGVKCIEHAFLMTDATAKVCKEKDVVISTQFVILDALQSSDAAKDLSAESMAKVKSPAMLDASASIAGLIQKHKLRTGFGTDLVGPIQHLQNQEFVLREKVGFTPKEILTQCTSESAEIIQMCGDLNRYGNFGVITPGARADILIHKENPLENISVLANPKEQLLMIMRDGLVFKDILHGDDTFHHPKPNACCDGH